MLAEAAEAASNLSEATQLAEDARPALTTLAQDLGTLLDDGLKGRGGDVTLRFADGEVSAHWFVLLARCPAVAEMGLDTAEVPAIDLTEFDRAAFSRLLR